MTKPRLLALTILVLAVAALVPFTHDLWIWAAYEPGHFRSEHLEKITQASGYQFVYYTKRAEWLLGARYYVPPQVCLECAAAYIRAAKAHQKCHNGRCVYPCKIVFEGDIDWTVLWAVCDSTTAAHSDPFTCTCPHPSHGEKKP